MTANKINVNKADINSDQESASKDIMDAMPLDLMGLLFFAYRDFVHEADELLSRQGFGRAHHRVLYFVNLRPGMTVADLLDLLKITKQSLARVLRQLIDNGYIEQRTGQKDRRKRLLYPTNKGAEFFTTLSANQSHRMREALDKLPPETKDTVARFFVEMIDPEDHGKLKNLNIIQN
ncbi:DNA-binding MarR family transcriptional regulator [Maritalea mobilis]|uniref:DNA-binding MarR family transcriptional regulator n=1 Tax=Maritalea mobilis TaxID=483324 RepID=A0A4R6VSC9_9HYPH|nr:MarR family transcriptional regulator [Maritalea mobilis]TDQ66939.1 DNA-binding MarR family transcriptional regulator [Maritalea mobilis]